MLFVCVHLYIYANPIGFEAIAVIAFIMLTLHAMIFTVLSMEVSVVSKGSVSYEYPREVFVYLGWSEWAANIPSHWTIFHPLNARYGLLHDRNQDDDNDDDNRIN